MRNFHKHPLLSFIIFVVLAVSAALVQAWERQVDNDVTILLEKRNNAWNHYGAKSVKSKLYTLERNRLILERQAHKHNELQAAKMAVAIEDLGSEISRYDREQDDIQNKAISLDRGFELSQRRLKALHVALPSIYVSVLLWMYASMLRLPTSKVIFTLSILPYLLGVGMSCWAWLLP